MKDKPLFYNARTVWRNENEGSVTVFTDWSKYEPQITENGTIPGLSAPADEKLSRYKGIYDRMGQEHMNDTFAHVDGKIFD